MANRFTQKIDRFDGGMANDIRDTTAGKFAASKNFDYLSFPHRLIPYRSYESGNDTVARKPSDFLYYNSKVWALGVKSGGSGEPGIFYKDSAAMANATWAQTANADADTTDARVPGCFVQFGQYLYGYAGNADLWKYDTTGGAVWAHTGSVAHSGRGVQGVVHPATNKLYFAGTNKIYGSSDGTTFTNELTLSSAMYINSIAVYGNYLAIASEMVDPMSGSSRVFLWDLSSTRPTETIDWGRGQLKWVEELDGYLIGATLEKRETSGGLLFHSSVIFKAYQGGGAREFYRIEGSREASISPISFLGTQRQKTNGRIYFPAILTLNEGSGSKEGIWSIGRNAEGQFAVSVEYQSSDGTVPNAIDGFFLAGSYMFIAYSNASTFSGNVSKTDDSANFTNSSQYETVVFDGGDASIPKKLIGVSVMTQPLPSGGQVVLKYAKDGDFSTTTTTSFTTIFTHSTAGSYSHSAINIESSGANLPEFNVIQFQIISTGGAVITGLSFDYEPLDKRLY